MNTRRDRAGVAAGLPMTPMIDIVFLLLVFFLVTVKPRDILAHLDVMRPHGQPGPVVPLLRLSVAPDGFALNGRDLTEIDLQTQLNRLAELDHRQTVVLECSPAAPHERLVTALNICARAGLDNLSVTTRP